jgi:hypothetical protein
MRSGRLALALLLLAPALGASAFHHDDLPLVFSAHAEGGASWAVRLDRAHGGTLAFDFTANGTPTSTWITFGLAIVDAQGRPAFYFALSGLAERDAPLDVRVVSLDPVDPTVQVRRGDPRCSLYCVGVDVNADTDATPVRLVIWEAGMSSMGVEVRAPDASAALQHQGSAWAIGDHEFLPGPVHERRLIPLADGANLGFKAIRGDHLPLQVEHRLYGFFVGDDFKSVCTAVSCVSNHDTLDQPFRAACRVVGCPTLALSWQGPGAGAHGGTAYSIMDQPPGAYDFRIDDMTEGYIDRNVDASPVAFADGAESWAFVSLADVEPPA